MKKQLKLFKNKIEDIEDYVNAPLAAKYRKKAYKGDSTAIKRMKARLKKIANMTKSAAKELDKIEKSLKDNEP